ncbi:virulence factor [Nisaea sp.]|uniref:virulence factor n=1 Tax=Nisaea sp. TaxID=2024842 RepID=UPI002B269B74|nr:virulence factor [Nisaea sp.]
MAHLIIVYWRDIPAQVIAERGRGRKREQAKIELPVRFIHAIDMAAMRDGSEDEGAYLEGWRRADPVECGDDLEAEAQAAAEALEGEYGGAKLKALIANGGNA